MKLPLPERCLRDASRAWPVVLLLLAMTSCDRPASPPGETPDAGGPSGHAHAEAGATCFICDASLRDPERLWCREHARYEDRCWVCQPQLEDKNRAYCAEHSLYEDECFLCHPELPAASPPERGSGGTGETPEEDGAAENGGTADAGESGGPGLRSGVSGEAPSLYCREHRVMERECGICQPQLAASLAPGESLLVRFVSEQSAAKAGIRTAAPRPADSRPGFAAFCTVRHNGNRLARITPLASGIIRRVLADLGSEVSEGDPLVEIHSAEIATAKTELVAAAVDHRLKAAAAQREERLVAKQISSEREHEEARSAAEIAALAVETARQRLLNLGLSAAEVAGIESARDGSALLVIRAPFAGTIVERNAVIGEAVAPGAALFTLADLGDVWLDLSLAADHTAVVESGLEVEATFAELPGHVARGTIDWVDAAVDERTRMLKARAVVPNDARKLRAGMFGKAEVAVRDVAAALRLPKSALQSLAGRSYVFVQLEDDLFALRRVLLGSGTERSIDVLQGVATGDEVVVGGSFTVLSELLKSRLGAGCVDE